MVPGQNPGSPFTPDSQRHLPRPRHRLRALIVQSRKQSHCPKGTYRLLSSESLLCHYKFRETINNQCLGHPSESFGKLCDPLLRARWQELTALVGHKDRVHWLSTYSVSGLRQEAWQIFTTSLTLFFKRGIDISMRESWLRKVKQTSHNPPASKGRDRI